MSNETIEDPALSFKALGLLAWLLSRPDGWEVNHRQIAAAHGDGEYAVRSALGELETAGYLRRSCERDPAGRWRHVSIISERPMPGDPDQAPLPLGEVPDGSPDERAPDAETADAVAVFATAEAATELNTELASTERRSPNGERENKNRDPKNSGVKRTRTRKTDNPLKRHAHRLAVAAMERDPKPTVATMSNPFPAVLNLVEAALRAGWPLDALERVIANPTPIVWTTAGLRSALVADEAAQRATNGPSPPPDSPPSPGGRTRSRPLSVVVESMTRQQFEKFWTTLSPVEQLAAEQYWQAANRQEAL